MQNCLKLLTGVPVKEIDAIDMGNASDVNKAKELLAYELTSLVHSKEDAEKAIATAKRLFSGEMDAEHMPATVVDAALVADGKASVLDLLVAAGLAPSKGEARRLVQQGGISVDGEKVTDVSAVVNAEALGKGIVIKKVRRSITVLHCNRKTTKNKPGCSAEGGPGLFFNMSVYAANA